MRTIHRIGRRTFAVCLILAAPLASAQARGESVQAAQVQDARVQEFVVEAPQAQGAGTPDSETFLEPGHYVWKPDPAASGPVKIVVSIPLQIAYVFKGRTLIGTSSVSTGLPGYDTPTGAFPILAKEVDHHSSLYDDAPMPFMQRLTWDGVALHAGKVTGQPASHGCVRLPLGFARKLYAETSLGAQVVIIDEAPLSADQAFAARAPTDMFASAQ